MPAGQSKYRRAVNTGEAMNRRLSKDNKGGSGGYFGNGTSLETNAAGNTRIHRGPETSSRVKSGREDRNVHSFKPTVEKLPATLYKPKKGK